MPSPRLAHAEITDQLQSSPLKPTTMPL